MKKLLIIGLLLACLPTYAHAGLFDFISNIVNVATLVAAAILLGPKVAIFTFIVMTFQQYKSDELKKQQEEQQRKQLESYNASLKDRTITSVTTEAPYVYVYGRARVGSAVVAIFVSGDRDQYQHLVCVHCAHEVDAIEEIYIGGHGLGPLDANGVPLTGRYVDTIRVKKHLGDASDPADATLISEMPSKWDANRVLRGFCYTYIRLDLNQQEFQGGIPSIEVLIKGKKVLDPRTSTTAWSENPALCLYDYLRSDFCQIPVADIPTADVIAAANICDEAIGVGARYTCNGTVSSDQDKSKVISQLAGCMSGGVNSTTWEMWAGKYEAPTVTIEQEDIIGQISVTPGISESEIYNGVTGRFISDENSYVPTDFKPYQNATYRASDGRDLYVSLEYPFTDETQRIHNLARIFIEDQRNSFTVKGVFSLKMWDTKIGVRVDFNSTFFGFTAKVFRVVGKSYNNNGTVELTLKEDTASIWDEADAVVLDSTPNSDLPNPFSLSTPGNPVVTEEIYETTGSAGVKYRAIITCPESSIRATGYIFEYKPNSSSIWNVLPTSSSPTVYIDDLPTTFYSFRVKVENAYFSTKSDYSGITTKEIVGLTAPPVNVSGFNVIAISGRALASWVLTTDLDVKIGGRIIIRHTPLTTGATWGKSYILDEFNGDAVNGNLPLMTGTYFAKFRDSTGNYSATADSFVATEALITGYTTTDTLTEHPDFTGAKTNLAATDNVLKLIGSVNIDDMLDNIDSWAEIDTIGGLVSIGAYEFSTYMDFASVTQRKIDVNLDVLSYDTNDLIDNYSDIDSLDSIDGGVINSTDATVYYRATNDDPAGAPTWGEWTQFMVADVSCRALEYKLELTTTNPNHQIEVSELSVRAREAA